LRKHNHQKRGPIASKARRPFFRRRPTYFIEIRFFGKAKRDIKQLAWHIDRLFLLRRAGVQRPVPHITLAGPFITSDEKRLKFDFWKFCSGREVMLYEADGFGSFDDTQVVKININPNEKLDKFRWELSNTLCEYCTFLKSYDKERSFNFHATVAQPRSRFKFEAIRRYIKTKHTPRFTHVVMRITLLKNGLILGEYDFLLRRMLSRREAKDKKILTQSFRELEKYQAGVSIPEIDLEAINRGLWDKVMNLLGRRKVFFIGDLHLNHDNIIDHVRRPFRSVYEMNKVIVSNWNTTIGKRDVAFFLGDLASKVGNRWTDYWLSKLNGKIYFIRGNHDDPSARTRLYERVIFKYKGQKFLLLHDPKEIPEDWNGWVIHGHKHDNDTAEYPLINKEKRTVNVGVELLDYKPLPLKKLLKLVE
jgi:calcineurin-like phosphoesterase family protein/2'-5' RNA ligase